MQKLYGLIGFPLGHSFSKGYFTEKFEQLGLSTSHRYELFQLPEASDLIALIAQNEDLQGINVTIPHKVAVLPLLDSLDASAQKVGAVNVIKITTDKKLIGYNSDYYGFKTSLEEWLTSHNSMPQKALVLGNGGAARAVMAALIDLGIQYTVVSRNAAEGQYSYEQLTESVMADNQLIINTSPVGTYPKQDQCPAIPYHFLSENHFLYDLVYNPAETTFMQNGAKFKAKTHNGLAMLHRQAEKAWEIWNI
jgi:shikimate dehydrogenase